MTNFDSDMIVITDTENLYNSFMAILFQDGKIRDGEHGMKFICQRPKLFHISYSCTFNLLKNKFVGFLSNQQTHPSTSCTSANP